MDFLTMAQRVRQECGVAGSGPSTVVDQTGMSRKLVDWTSQAWIELQLKRPNWLFMHAEFTGKTLTIGQRDYSQASFGLSDVKLWDFGSMFMYDPDLGTEDEAKLPYKKYLDWKSAFRAGMASRPQDRPQVFTDLPNGSIRMEPVPDKAYVLAGEYKRTTQTLAANTDEPTGLPEDFHMMIVWMAVMKYADDQNAAELLDKAVEGYDPLLIRLEIEQLPRMELGFDALA